MSSSLTSDNDYLKLFMQGTNTISGSGSADSDSDPLSLFRGSFTVNHNLGYVPMVRSFHSPKKDGVWYDSFEGTTYASGGIGLRSYPTVAVDTTNAKFILNENLDNFSDIPVFYRIYEFGDKAFSTDDIIDNVFAEDIISVSAGSGSYPAATYTATTIPHGTGAVPNWNVSFSPDGGTTWYGGSSFYRSGSDQLTAFGGADSTNFYIIVANYFPSPQSVLVRYSLDYRVSPILLSTDNNTYKYSGTVRTASLSVGGTLAAGATQTQTTTPIAINSPDFCEVMFSNSNLSGGTKYHRISEGRSPISSTMSITDDFIVLTPIVTATTIAMRAQIFNPYGGSNTYASTTLNFRFIPYESTLS